MWVTNIANFIVVFLYGFIPALILYAFWFFLKRKINIFETYRALIICCLIILSLGFHYKASYNIIGYQMMTYYLEGINTQRIKETGSSISLEEENEIKEKISQDKEFLKIKNDRSLGMSLAPSIFTIAIMFFLFKKSKINEIKK